MLLLGKKETADNHKKSPLYRFIPAYKLTVFISPLPDCRVVGRYELIRRDVTVKEKRQGRTHD